MLALDEQRVPLLVLLPVCLNLKCVLESADYEVVCNLILMRYFVVQINNTLQW